MLLVDPASGYLVRRSSDGGRSWSYTGTPALPGTSPGPVDISGGIALLPDGDLLFVGGGGPWYLLAKGSGSWCRVQQKAGANPHQMFVDGSPVVIGGRLWWLQSDPNTPSRPTPGSRPLSSLTCST